MLLNILVLRYFPIDVQTKYLAIETNSVRDIATFIEQPLQYGGCISDFQNHCCNLISKKRGCSSEFENRKKEVAATILKIANTTSNLVVPYLVAF